MTSFKYIGSVLMLIVDCEYRGLAIAYKRFHLPPEIGTCPVSNILDLYLCLWWRMGMEGWILPIKVSKILSILLLDDLLIGKACIDAFSGRRV